MARKDNILLNKDFLIQLKETKQGTKISPDVLTAIKNCNRFDAIELRIMTEILRITAPKSVFTDTLISSFFEAMCKERTNVVIPILDIINTYKIMLLLKPEHFVSFLKTFFKSRENNENQKIKLNNSKNKTKDRCIGPVYEYIFQIVSRYIDENQDDRTISVIFEFLKSSFINKPEYFRQFLARIIDNEAFLKKNS
ncbi:hypothetical protein EDEG_00814 [Edhazardia aedis USNM 41457]|uniref:Uncharacterized protein n=1 Tax=Edhazardia aedis (strain USNM 41457) TaxID=1003232 RepID=J9DBK2_EDHAE|nr:hypothetical protein EDEG_00814 [Edhazardia aedis USNM 41457]|eukprot:EJW05101.1 hypothetical protein EDEG_00814 [Edhazardia aedis USNM 41457]